MAAEEDTTIEDFLGLSEEEIQRRMDALEKTLPTRPGTAFLRARDRVFNVQPWPFLSYLAHWKPDLLSKALGSYGNYDGNENKQAVMEGLRERYINLKLIQKLERG